MIFQHTHELVMSGAKTQTRRLIVKGEFSYDSLVQSGNRVKYEVGKIYAVQPARGKPAIGRILLTGIRREDVRLISHEDALAEGFSSRGAFWVTWCATHDKIFGMDYLPMIDKYNHRLRTVKLGQSISAFMLDFMQRPPELYQAWVLEFELVKEATNEQNSH